MDFSSTRLLDDGTRERRFTLDGAPGVLWTPSTASPSTPVPLVLLGHPGGLQAMQTRLEARARQSAGLGYASATLELPGGGGRPPVPEIDRARDDLREAIGAGRRPDDDVVDRLVLPLVEQAVPEWRALLDAVLALPEVGGPVAVSGGVTAMGVRLAAVEPRVVAVGLFAGTAVPRSIIEEARRVTVPVHVLLQWDDQDNDRQRALELFDAFGSPQKTLQANTGGHTGVPPHAGEDAGRFLVRHLG
ncbi:alpha/beta hydrolase [Cellulomonas sp. zg-ZUI199]|uniref:Alpha/beta hydrolase n=1 Tax=Cellulomonas wangleii TaxID=2816956 RepID=A0ABX8D6H6_9CELL|nr:alpha/beta hydrolase [Cellulomonas wangleii]MBO0926224.1 alpha/beta hydrolase [Cellulomonas wangleii]QVI62731.1 alpha/beta hydrolase [Cellulomonas wangleii]